MSPPQSRGVDRPKGQSEPDEDGDERDFITIHTVSPIDDEAPADLLDQLLESRTQPGSQSGYMMRFGTSDYRGLNPYDVISLPGKSYPVSEAALDSLPAYVRAQLQQDGAVQILANYDQDGGGFSDVAVSWEDQSPIDRIAELIGLGHSLHEAIDYVVVEEEGAYSVAQWAAIRGVETEEAIKQNVRAVRRRIDGDEDGRTE